MKPDKPSPFPIPAKTAFGKEPIPSGSGDYKAWLLCRLIYEVFRWYIWYLTVDAVVSVVGSAV